MAKKISQLTAATSLASTDLVAIVDVSESVTKSATLAEIVTAGGAGGGGSAPTGDYLYKVTAGAMDAASVQVTDALVASNAEIAVSKLADGAAYQVVQTAADGTTVQWGAIDLTTAAVTGVLPKANQGAQDLAGDATGTTAAAVNTQARGLKSATTTVSVSAATAPTAGQVLTATSSTAATWQAPSTRVGTQAMADANQTPSAALLANGTIKLTGAITDERNLTLPALLDATARMWVIDNQCTGAFGVKVWDGGAGTFVTVPNGQTRTVLMDSRGALSVSHGLAGTGEGSFCFGTAATSTSAYSIALGAYNTASAAAAVAIGEFCTASAANANAIGYANGSSGTYSSSLGSYCYATGDYSVAIGLQATSSRVGEFTHGSGVPNSVGLHSMDLYKELVATTGNLGDRNGAAFNLSQLSYVHMRVTLMAVQTAGAAKQASEVHEITVNTVVGPTATIIRDTCTDGAGTIAAQGWSVTISAPAGAELRFAANSGADTVRFLARLEWAEIGNL